MELVSVQIEPSHGGAWQVTARDRRSRHRFETLADARHAAFMYAQDARPCEVVVRDAYNRVVQHETVDAQPA